MSDKAPESLNSTILLELTTKIVSAYAAKAHVSPHELVETIAAVSHALLRARSEPAHAAPPPVPAVPIKKSVTPDFIICLDDGKKLRMLKRHLMSTYGMTPDQYRAKWGLPKDYPMVAPNYAKTRSELAKKIGLGRQGEEAAAPPEPVTSKPEPAQKRKAPGRRKASAP